MGNGRRVVGAALGAFLALAAGAARAETGAAAIERALVRIVNHAQRGNWYSPWDVSSAREGGGSGFVIAGGRVMTNAHVVSDSRMVLMFLQGDPTPHVARVAATGHDCDLALLEPVDPTVLAGVAPLSSGDLPAIRSTVETYGYPSGGLRLSSTRGVVSRIELQSYVHSALDAHLTIQTDAAINPGNSGGPVVQDGLVVGVAFQGTSALENVGFVIPTDVVRHFLTDVADGTYDGYPELGALTANLENPAARAAAGMAPGETGVRVHYVFPGSSADGELHPGDVILAVGGHDLANDGTVALGDHRFEFGVLADRLQAGESLPLRVLRGGERLGLAVTLRTYPPQKRFANSYDQLPRYLVYAGLVFLPLDREMLKTYGSQWSLKAPKALLYEFFFRFFEEPERLRGEPVVLLRCLDHPVNMNLAWRQNALIDRVNGREIDGLASLVAALEANRDPYHVLEFGEGGRFDVLDRAQADAAHAEILQTYGVHGDRRL